MAPLRLHSFLLLLLVGAINIALADDDWAPIPRRLPPEGIKLSDADRKQIETALAHLEGRLSKFAQLTDQWDLLADVEVFAKAVRFALLHGEFYKPTDVKKALDLLAAGEKRADEFSTTHSWTNQRGPLVRAYHSTIDGSVQPYGLEIPKDLDLSKPVPLYVWLHGRGDTTTDMHFVAERMSRKGQIAPAGAIVLHPFGRHCLGFKSAGEIDIFEAIDSVKHRYNIDPDRVILIGFSMGGAGAWHIGAHYADQFAAVHAGAGFVDVARYQKLTPDKYPAWYEQKLWGVYDVPDYVRNLFNVTTVAYGGEIDPQRASAQIMAEAFKAEGHELTFIIGPNMPHKYDPASLAHIMSLMHDAQEKGRDRFAKQISLQTRTLRYNQMHWATITALHHHWEDARLDATIVGDRRIKVTTKNVDGFTLRSPWPTLAGSMPVTIEVDGHPAEKNAGIFASDADFTRTAGGWSLVGDAPADPPGTLRKRHGLQGPIDDAFMEPFLVVLPSGKCADPQVQKWVEFESRHLQDRWRAVFRGDLRIKHDSEVTDEDIRQYHLLLWGDPQGNSMIAKMNDRLPIHWNQGKLNAGDKTFDASTHVPLVIYPNPLNTARYVVLNSGPTFREADDRTNSLQNPKLPDWAILDITTRPDEHRAGKVEDAGFFDENWKLDRKE